MIIRPLLSVYLFVCVLYNPKMLWTNYDQIFRVEIFSTNVKQLHFGHHAQWNGPGCQILDLIWPYHLIYSNQLNLAVNTNGRRGMFCGQPGPDPKGGEYPTPYVSP